MLLWVTTFSFFLQLWQVKLCSISLLVCTKMLWPFFLAFRFIWEDLTVLATFTCCYVHWLALTNQAGWKCLLKHLVSISFFSPIERHFLITVLATENASKLWQSLTWWQISQGRLNARNTADVAKCEACMPS